MWASKPAGVQSVGRLTYCFSMMAAKKIPQKTLQYLQRVTTSSLMSARDSFKCLKLEFLSEIMQVAVMRMLLKFSRILFLAQPDVFLSINIT